MNELGVFAQRSLRVELADAFLVMSPSRYAAASSYSISGKAFRSDIS